MTAFVGGISVLGAGVAFAAPPANLAAPAVNPNPVAPGGDVTASGAGCVDSTNPDPAAEVEIAVNNPDGSTYSDTVRPDASGAWSATLTATDAVGVYTLTATCDTYNSSVAYPAIKITVAAAGGTTAPAGDPGAGNATTVNAGMPSTPTKELAATGTDATALLPAAAGLLALGGITLFAGRRKHDA